MGDMYVNCRMGVHIGEIEGEIKMRKNNAHIFIGDLDLVSSQFYIDCHSRQH
jgi:hypothetical protein